MGDAATSLRTAKGWGSASVKYRLGCQDSIVPDSPFRQELLECSPVIGLAGNFANRSPNADRFSDSPRLPGDGDFAVFPD